MPMMSAKDQKTKQLSPLSAGAPKRKKSRKESRQKGLEVIENPLVNQFITSSVPSDLKSPLYPFQASIGVAGIALLFISFRFPVAFFFGAALLIVRHHWRKRTDEPAVDYRKAIVFLRKKKYQDCIDSLESIMSNPKTPAYLHLIKASCLLEQEKTREAYAVYRSYFETVPSSEWSFPEYWSAQENAILLALDQGDVSFARMIADHLSESDAARPDAASWKKHYQKLCQKELHSTAKVGPEETSQPPSS